MTDRPLSPFQWWEFTKRVDVTTEAIVSVVRGTFAPRDDRTDKPSGRAWLAVAGALHPCAPDAEREVFTVRFDADGLAHYEIVDREVLPHA